MFTSVSFTFLIFNGSAYIGYNFTRITRILAGKKLELLFPILHHQDLPHRPRKTGRQIELPPFRKTPGS